MAALPSENLPKPGTQDAIDLGCVCTKTLNFDGAGMLFIADNGDRLYEVSLSCPVHGRNQ